MFQPEFISDFNKVEKEKHVKVGDITDEHFAQDEAVYFQSVLASLQLTYLAETRFVSFDTREHYSGGVLTFHEDTVALEGLQRLAFVRSVLDKKSKEYITTFHRNELERKTIRAITAILELDRIIGGS